MNISWFVDLPLQELSVVSMTCGLAILAFALSAVEFRSEDQRYGIWIKDTFIKSSGIFHTIGVVGAFYSIYVQSSFIATIPVSFLGEIILGGGSVLFYKKIYEFVFLRKSIRKLPGGIILKIKIKLAFVGISTVIFGATISYLSIFTDIDMVGLVLTIFTIFIFVSSISGISYRLFSVRDRVPEMFPNWYKSMLFLGIILLTGGTSMSQLPIISFNIYSYAISEIAYIFGFVLSVKYLYTTLSSQIN